MKTKITEIDKANEHLLCNVLGLSDPQYKAMRLECLCNYVNAYANTWTNSKGLAEKLICSDLFERWYINAFNRRNWQFAHQFCLKSYLNRISAGRKVRASKKQLWIEYRKAMQIDPNYLYPDIETMRLILTKNH